MNRFWIVTVVLLSVNLTISNPVTADSALKDVRIFKGINPIRPPNTPHTIPRRYIWSFNGKYYTAIMGIDQKRYNGYSSRRSRNPRYLSRMVAEGTDALQDLVRAFHKIIPRDWTDEKKVNFVLAFVQHLAYVPDKETTQHNEFFKHALETLVERGGDCEDTSVLSASILNGMGFELVLIWPKGHIAIGVKGNFSGCYYPYKKNTYYFCETTGIGWKLGNLPPDIPRYANIIPITPKRIPSEPEKAMPVVPTQPTPPRSNLSSIALVKGINQYETELEFEKAIVSFKYALDRGDLDSEQRALAHLYWGCSELGRTNRTEPDYNYYIDKAERQLSKVFRHNPNQELPSKLRSKRKIRSIFEQVRKESIGELTVSASLPQTTIWIDGRGVNRKMLGTAPVSLKLFKGTYTVEGIYKGRSIKEIVKIAPNSHERLEIKILPTFVDDSPPRIVLLDSFQTVKANQRITVKAKITDDTSIRSVYLFYGFAPFKDSRPSEYHQKKFAKSSSNTYTGYIPAHSKVGYVWYYLTATDEGGKKGESEKKVLKVLKVKPPDEPYARVEPPVVIPVKPVQKPSSSFVVGESKSPMHEGIWANHAWLGDIFGSSASAFDWSSGDTLSFAYLREGKTHQTFGAQLDVSYHNSTDSSAMLQWGPALGKSPIVFTFLGGVTGYKISDSDHFETMRTPLVMNRDVSDASSYITPVLGASLKLYPLDSVTIDATGSLKLPSVFDTTYLHHYEIEMRVYIARPLNLKIGYGQWYVGSRNITRMQMGLGFTF